MEYKIYAKCVRKSENFYTFKHDLKVGEIYEVDEIDIAGNSAKVFINGKGYNYMLFEFYINNKKINKILEYKEFNPFINKYPGTINWRCRDVD